jgi:hypothetical protein
MAYNRRKFITLTATLAAGMSASAITQTANQGKKQVIHHVFFWLKNPNSKEDQQKLLDGLGTLRKIETVKRLYIGVPAETEHRPVVDSSFSASELMFFDDLAGQKVYQDHPIHQKFIADCSHLWEKVIVYDVSDI